jgi:hypothetical protein
VKHRTVPQQQEMMSQNENEALIALLALIGRNEGEDENDENDEEINVLEAV